MLMKMLRQDVAKNRMITAALFVFIFISALLVASGTNMIIDLSNSLANLFTKSSVPHFVQMHTGEINKKEIERWAANNSLIKQKQIVEMINIDGSNLYMASPHSEKNSVMDIDFVTQNRDFDWLLNLNNEIVQVAKGEIAVPVYYMQRDQLHIGDKIKIVKQDLDMELTIVGFVRDAQMNPSIIHSKRFVVNEADYNRLKSYFGEVEYLIEFQLNDSSKLSAFSNEYQASALPKKGPTLEYHLFWTLNAVTDGLIIAVIIIVSLLLNIIAILCIRFTILASIEEDYREIGVMKAIGLPQPYIKKIYLTKYIAMAGVASAIGFIASLFLNELFASNMMLYMGTAPKSTIQHIIPFLAVIAIFAIVVVFCKWILRRFNNISAVEALRSGSMGEIRSNRGFLFVHKTKWLNLHFFLGFRDIFQRFKLFRLLLIVFIVASFIIIVPINFLHTIQSPGFITYMGIGRSDIRIDLRQSDDMVRKYESMLRYLQQDKDVKRFSPLVTCQFKMINSDGLEDNINVELGDFSIFPLEYVAGAAPKNDNEIALSYLNGKELKAGVGDKLRFTVNGAEKELTVSGIYQDVTNGGRTAKALLPYDSQTMLWYAVSLDVQPNVSISQKIDEYTKAFYPARVTDLEGYLHQTLGTTIDQLKLVARVAIVIALSVSILITALFLRMLIAKDYSQIAIMKSIGFSLRHIRVQYITRSLLVLVIGILIGTLISNTVGQMIVSVMLSFMGASHIDFVIDPVQAYFLCPLLLLVAVTITTFICIRSIKKYSIIEMNSD